MKRISMILVTLLCAALLAACGKKAEATPAPSLAVADSEPELGYFEEDEYLDEGDETYESDEMFYEDELPESLSPVDNNNESVDVVGKWYTEGYDVDTNWAMSYCIELTADGKASCEGYRNKDTGTYTTNGDAVTITFDKCAVDEAGNGYADVKDFVYTVEMKVNGDDATIKIDAPDIISNLENGTVHRGNAVKTEVSNENTPAEATNVADGSYFTDETYSGDITADASTVTITTGLGHYDKDWNMVKDYDKQTFTFKTSKDCQCVIMQEDVEKYPVSKQVEFINEFLHGNSGLPVGLVIKNGELVEISFSS